MRALRGFGRAEGGQTVVEFALSVTVLLIIVLGIFDLGRAVWHSNTLSLATREAVRCAIVSGPGCTGTKVPADVVAAYSIGIRPTPQVTTTYCALPPSLCSTPETAPTVGSYVTVSATSVYVPLASRFFLNGALNVTLSGSSTLLIRNDAAAPTASPSPSPSPTTPPCPVPYFVGTRKNSAQGTWTGAGFTTTVLFNPNPNGNWVIGVQSRQAGSTPLCTVTITLGP